jgi:hypothetical protein
MHYLVCRKAIEYNRETVDHIRGAVLCLLKGGVDVNQPNRCHLFLSHTNDSSCGF